MELINSLSDSLKQVLFVFFGVLVSVLISVLIMKTDVLGPLFLVLFFASLIYLLLLFKSPFIGLVTIIVYSFMSGFIGRELFGIPSGILEALLLITMIAAALKYSSEDLSVLQNSLVYLMLIWFIISFLEVLNPAGGSIEGWLAELRPIALYPLLATSIGFLLLRHNKDLNYTIILILGLALISTLNGIRQLKFGLTEAEQTFLDEGGATTHLLWGKLRVFSFWDAAQFGCSQAQFAIISIVLAFSKIKLWKRILLLGLAAIFLYGMLISGTRTAIIVIVTGAFTALALSKNFKIIFLGGAFLILFLGVLKYTTIGSGNYEIYRFRSALNPQDASLNLRFINQELFGEYLKNKPLGGGLGVTGHFGHRYNADHYLSKIEPDSIWIKIWAMYGIVGLVFWFSMYMYIFGKGCGIIWNIKDDKLRFKLIALLSGVVGIFFCGYSNEVMNIIPSLFVVSISMVFVFQGPRLDHELEMKREILN